MMMKMMSEKLDWNKRKVMNSSKCESLKKISFIDMVSVMKIKIADGSEQHKIDSILVSFINFLLFKNGFNLILE